MAYVKTNWQKGDKINADKLNNIEQGIEGAYDLLSDLDNVDNFPTATQEEAEEGILNDRFMTPLRTAEAISSLESWVNIASVKTTSTVHEIEFNNLSEYKLLKLVSSAIGVSNSDILVRFNDDDGSNYDNRRIFLSGIYNSNNTTGDNNIRLNRGARSSGSFVFFDINNLKANQPKSAFSKVKENDDVTMVLNVMHWNNTTEKIDKMLLFPSSPPSPSGFQENSFFELWGVKE